MIGHDARLKIRRFGTLRIILRTHTDSKKDIYDATDAYGFHNRLSHPQTCSGEYVTSSPRRCWMWQLGAAFSHSEDRLGATRCFSPQ